ncbi:MAG: DUF6183 family protein [Planctomycetes bacterium]|nr:DUF6183 family protein [Planctomycetota bacterium]
MTDIPDSFPPFDARETLSRATESDWRYVFAEVDMLGRERRWSDLGALRSAAGERSAKPHIAVRERIENLAAADVAGMSALAEWIAVEAVEEERRGELADRLAQAHAWPLIAAAGFRDDVLLLAAHARVLRREDLSADTAALGAARHAAERGDPLGRLSLAPLPLERAAWLPLFTAEGASWTLPFGAHVEGLTPVVASETHLAVQPLSRESIPAFTHWAIALAATGRPAGAGSPAAAAGAFAALAAEAAREAAATRVRETTPAEAWAYLFCAAFAGDAGPRRSAGRARLAAWQTLAALAEFPPEAADFGRFAPESAWWLLDVEGPWFGRKARDAALVGRFDAHWAAVAATERA